MGLLSVTCKIMFSVSIGWEACLGIVWKDYSQIGMTENLMKMDVSPLSHRDTFWLFCKQSRPRSGSSCKSYLIRLYSVSYGNMIRYDPTLVNLTSIFFVLCTNMKFIFIYIIIHGGWSLAWIFMKGRIKPHKATTYPGKWIQTGKNIAENTK